MKRCLGWLGLALVVGCGPSAQNDDAAARDDAAANVDAAGTDDADVDAGTAPAMVTFEIERLVLSDATPAAGASVCIVGAPSDRCVAASALGSVSILLEANTDHVLELSTSGYRPLLYPVHADSADFARSNDLGFYTLPEDEAYYATTIQPGTATLTLRAESSPVLAAEGDADILMEVVDPTGVVVAYAAADAASLDPTLTQTTISGLAGAVGLFPGTVDARGHDVTNGGACHAWFGGFEVGTGSDAVLRIPVQADHDTRFEMRCW